MKSAATSGMARWGLCVGIVAIAAMSVVVGCSSSGAPASLSYPVLGIRNATTIPVTLRVNGSDDRPVAAGTVLEMPLSELPSPPWMVEAVSPTGRVLVSLTVSASDAQRAQPTIEGQGILGSARLAVLSCGSIELYYGPPGLGPAPLGTPAPGDCA